MYYLGLENLSLSIISLKKINFSVKNILLKVARSFIRII